MYSWISLILFATFWWHYSYARSLMLHHVNIDQAIFVLAPRKMTNSSCHLQQRITIEPGTSYRLQGLKPNSLYYFRLSARSPQGLGASTAEISARTMQSSRCLSLLPSCPFLTRRKKTIFSFNQQTNLLMCWVLNHYLCGSIHPALETQHT